MHLPGMKNLGTSDSRSRRLLALLVGLFVLVVLTGVGVYGLMAGPRTSNDNDNDSGRPGQVATMPSGPVLTATPQMPTIRGTGDPEAFARVVAEALFTWDTASGFMPLDYTSVILAVGDPSGAEQAGLASDIATYLPNRDAWVELRRYATRQHIVIDDVFVPEAWAAALEQARPAQLADGTVAYTLKGTRHRDGVWNDELVSSEHPVTFTVFLVCGPTYDTCHLLRLSQLDNPLR